MDTKTDKHIGKPSREDAQGEDSPRTAVTHLQARDAKGGQLTPDGGRGMDNTP